MPIVDTHTHFIPREFVELLRSGGGPPGVQVVDRPGREPLIAHANGLRYPVLPVFDDVEAKLAQMDRDRIDIALCSISPSLFLYELEPAETLAAHRLINDAAAAFARGSGGRIHAMACVPLNDPPAAAAELRRARTELGLAGVEIGPSVGALMLDAPELEPLFAAAEELATPVLLHPYQSMIAQPGPELAGFHLSNVLGNPFETGIAAARLIAGGVLDRHPNLCVQLVHGGGAFPYQVGRLAHAYEVREETRAIARHPPLDYLDRFLFDTLVFDERALRFLLEVAGHDRVVFGSDTPFDMADLSATDSVPRLASRGAAAKVLGDTALEAYGIA